jgi:hypothetical protein
MTNDLEEEFAIASPMEQGALRRSLDWQATEHEGPGGVSQFLAAGFPLESNLEEGF